MTIAIWLIVLIEAVRTIQNAMQLGMARQRTKSSERATDEFIKSLNKSDREFVKDMLEAFERNESDVVPIKEVKCNEFKIDDPKGFVADEWYRINFGGTDD